MAATFQLPAAPRQSLGEIVAASLRQAILSGAIKPRERIIETEIAASMRVSRGPVREALASLEKEGLLLRQNNRGAQVQDFTPRDEVEIRSLRTSLETLAVRQVIQRDDPACAALLRANQRRFSKCRSPLHMAEVDLEFHEIIIRAADHTRLLDAWLNLRSQVRLIMLLHLHNENAQAVTLDGHDAIVDAIEARDPTRAVALIEQLLLEAKPIS